GVTPSPQTTTVAAKPPRQPDPLPTSPPLPFRWRCRGRRTPRHSSRHRSAQTERSRTYTRAMTEVDLAAAARLLAEPARMARLEALLGGDPRSGRQLAAAAGVAPSTASEHLTLLQDGGLVTATKDGRKRAYSLSGPPVAEALEALAALAPPKPVT